MSQESQSRANLPAVPDGFDPSKPLRDRARENFCQGLAAGESLYDAFAAAGFKRPAGNAQRLLREPEVAARVAYLLEKVAPLDETLLAWRRLQHRRALENVAGTNRLSLFVPTMGYVGKGKGRRAVVRGVALKPFDELTPDQLALIDGIEITDKGVLKVSMPKRLDARAQLAKLDGLDKPVKVAPTNSAGDGPASLTIEIVKFAADAR